MEFDVSLTATYLKSNLVLVIKAYLNSIDKRKPAKA